MFYFSPDLYFWIYNANNAAIGISIKPAAALVVRTTKMEVAAMEAHPSNSSKVIWLKTSTLLVKLLKDYGLAKDNDEPNLVMANGDEFFLYLIRTNTRTMYA